MEGRSYNPKLVDRIRDRDRNRHAPYNVNILGRKPGGNKEPPFNRVFISNIPYDEKWQDLKDIFRKKVGEVTYVELMTDDQGNSKGYGIVELKTKELATEAVEKMNGHMLNERNLVVKEDFYGEFLAKALRRDTQKNPVPQDNSSYGLGHMPLPLQGMPLQSLGQMMPTTLMPPAPQAIHERRGMNEPSGIDRDIMEITGGAPVGNTVFVANLDYSVTYPKLKEVFSLAGKVTKIDLLLDNDNKSRGMANITFETDIEALQAISMLNKQLLFDRPMVVKMDKGNAVKQEKSLPSGLQSIGPSLNLSGIADSYGRQGNSSYGDSPRNGSSSGVSLGDSLYSTKSTPDSIYGINLDSLSAGITKAQVGASSYSGRSGIGDVYSSLGISNSSAHSLDRYRDASSMNQNRNYGQGLQGMQYMTDRFANQGRGNDRSLNAAKTGNCVYAVNLPYSMTWKEVKEKFSEVGNVLFVEMKTENGKSKGQAQIRYDSSASATRAAQRLNGIEINGRNIKVRTSP